MGEHYGIFLSASSLHYEIIITLINKEIGTDFCVIFKLIGAVFCTMFCVMICIIRGGS